MKLLTLGLAVMLITFASNPAFAKDITCFKHQMDGWDEPSYHLPDNTGAGYDFLKDITPYKFRATGPWKSYRGENRMTTFKKRYAQSNQAEFNRIVRHL